MQPGNRTILAALSLAALIAVGTAPAGPAAAQTGQPPAPSPSVAQADKEDMRLVLRKLRELGAQPVENLTPAQARRQPTPADAVAAVLRDQGADPAVAAAQRRVTRTDLSYPGANGPMALRVYTPDGADGPLPVIVFFHGGGWVIGGLDAYESSATALAGKANAIVASADYRKAPEHKFPAAHDDAFAAYRWVRENAARFNGDPARVAVAGESAGGNLAAATALLARDNNIAPPAHMLLIYPVAGTDMTTPSYQAHAEAAPLSRAGMAWFFSHYLRGQEDKQNPLINLYSHADLRGLPSATIVNAAIDPLESDGRLLADKLRIAGILATRLIHEGVTHEFFGMDAVLDDARRAQAFAAMSLREAFSPDTAATQGRSGTMTIR